MSHSQQNSKSIQSKYLKQILDSTKDCGNTFITFAFKTPDKNENYFVQQYIQGSLNNQNVNSKKFGTMAVTDLWSNKQQQSYIKSRKFTNDRYYLQKINGLNYYSKIKKLEQNIYQNQKQNIQDINQISKFQHKYRSSMHLPKTPSTLSVTQNQFFKQPLQSLNNTKFSKEQEAFNSLYSKINSIHIETVEIIDEITQTQTIFNKPKNRRTRNIKNLVKSH